MTQGIAIQGPGETPAPYSRLSIGLHWFMLLLLAAVSACIELREVYPRGSAIRDGLKTWHYLLGLSVFGLVGLRLLARIGAPRLAGPRSWTDWLAAAVHLALYAIMIAMPILGWLALSADGKAVAAFGLQLPALIAPSEALAGQLEEVHETLGTVGYWLVGAHATAALFHHYVLRDGVLRRMLPGVG
jgi:cytochrome b561